MNEHPTAASGQGRLDLQIVQGDTREFVLAFHNDAGKPFNLSGYSIRMEVKNKRSINASPIISKTIGNGLSIDGHALSIHFGSETLDLGLDNYSYDILFSNGPDKKRWVFGNLLISKSVTR